MLTTMTKCFNVLSNTDAGGNQAAVYVGGDKAALPFGGLFINRTEISGYLAGYTSLVTNRTLTTSFPTLTDAGSLVYFWQEAGTGQGAVAYTNRRVCIAQMYLRRQLNASLFATGGLLPVHAQPVWQLVGPATYRAPGCVWRHLRARQRSQRRQPLQAVPGAGCGGGRPTHN